LRKVIKVPQNSEITGVAATSAHGSGETNSSGSNSDICETDSRKADG